MPFNSAFRPVIKVGLFFALLFGTVLVIPLSVSAQAPSNNECSGAITLPVNNNISSNLVYKGALGYATESMPACIRSSYPAKDVWYKFVATSATHNITLKPIEYADYTFEVFSGTCGSLQSIACINLTYLDEMEVTVLTNLSVGETYFIRVYNVFGSASPSGTFSICINTNTSTINNDECEGAINISTDGTRYRSTNIGATLSMPACAGMTDRDIWFKFTATSSRHRIYTGTLNGGPNDPVVMEFFEGRCGALVPRSCFNKSGQVADFTDLVRGRTYYYRAYFGNGSGLNTDFTTSVYSPGLPPKNDECTGAVTLPVNNNTSTTLSYTTNFGTVTESMPSCVAGVNTANDAWYKFTATSTTHNLTITPETYDDFIFEVFKGDCQNLVSIACVNVTFSNEKEAAVLTDLNVGETYYLRLYERWGKASQEMRLNICINTNTSTIPNDECEGATNVEVSSPTAISQVISTNVGATLSRPACIGAATNDIWFKFIAKQSRQQVVCGAESGNDPIAVEVFKGSCTGLTSIFCKADPSQLSDLQNLTVGATYYYRVYFSNGSDLRTNISTRVVSVPPPPANDECRGAVALAVNKNGTNTLNYNGTLGYSTQSMAGCIDYGLMACDVWYKFTAASATHTINLTPTSFDDYILEAFSGSCDQLTSLACVNNTGLNEKEVVVLNNLVPGQNYYIRVYGGAGWSSPSKTFNISINSNTVTIPNDECSGAINIPTTGYQYGVAYSNIGATLSLPGCSGTANNDIWFKFKANTTRHQIAAATSSGDLPVFIELFKGSCSDLTSILCFDYASGVADIDNLTPGQTYYYRLYISAGSPLRTDFITYVNAVGPPVTFPGVPVLAAGRQCANDTLKIAVSGIGSGNTCKGYCDGIEMTFDKDRSILWLTQNQPGKHVIRAIQLSPDNLSSDTSVAETTTDVPLTPRISILPTSSICKGSTLTLTADYENGGSQPNITWWVNNTIAATAANTYTASSFKNEDQVWVVLKSSEFCVTSKEVVSTPVSLSVKERTIMKGAVDCPDEICASAFKVNVSPAIDYVPLNSAVELFEISNEGVQTSAGTALFAGEALQWDVTPVNASATKRYFAVIVPPDEACAAQNNTDTAIIRMKAMPNKPVISTSRNLLEVANPEPAANYVWEFQEGTSWQPVAGGTGTSLAASRIGIYHVIAQKDGCSNISEDNELVSIPNINAYPNPVTDILYIGPLLASENWRSADIFGINGICYLTEDIRKKETAAITVANLPKGMYIVKLINSAGKELQWKFMKL
ncbi:T9SS type A sorting domain-containing protein [Chitinophaga filiformis]|uniref:T9SS type A sorting domain-containing protein n=1 Tax=Chitinophaga filiformis TaxID=104663 RepID=UPI001F3653CF|nr:T9SS type A sorting domain-containing protein [Chitinophaga filiformis]MCF6407207.1 T9SS type A sorting domain-containing protein [Chitinophaga filiformis]